MTRFSHGEIVYLLKKWPEFSIYENGNRTRGDIHGCANKAGVKITTRIEPMQGVRHGYLMGRDSFTIIIRKGEGQ